MSRGGPSNVLTSQRHPEKSGLQPPGESLGFFFLPLHLLIGDFSHCVSEWVRVTRTFHLIFPLL